MASTEERQAAIEKMLKPVRDLFDGLPDSPDVQELRQRFVEYEASMRGWATSPPPPPDRAALRQRIGELAYALAAARKRHGVQTMPPPPVAPSGDDGEG